MHPTVSIIVTCYNYGEYVAECLKSIQKQTFKDFEVTVVDDGSTDNSIEKIKLFLDDERFKYIKKKNSGQAKAKNTGIRESRGNYIAFLDADDYWEINKLEKQLPLFSTKRVGVVYSRARYVNAIGDHLNIKLSGEFLKPRRGKVTDYLLMDNFVPFSSSIVRRECFFKTSIFDESLKMGIDWDLWLRISTKYQFEFVDEPLLIYRMGHSGQMSKNIEERQRCSDRILTNFIKRYPDHATKRSIRRAWGYTYLNRGLYQTCHDRNKALIFFLRSFYKWPFSLRLYVGMLKLVCTLDT